MTTLGNDNLPTGGSDDWFRYRTGELFAEAVPVARVAEAVGTPCYVYSALGFATLYRRLADALDAVRPLVFFAVKANSNQAVLRLFAGLGAGADVVSEGELRRALAAGIPAERIVFSGVGKRRGEIAAALTAGIHQINAESLPELERIEAVAAQLGRTAPVAIRVNPDVDARTHAKIATGRKDNKFGIDLADAPAAFRRAAALPHLEPVGLAMHIGSQLTELDPYRRAFERLAELVLALRADGFAVRRVDLGGGLGIRYHAETPPDPGSYAALVAEVFGGLDVELGIEPGRALTGPAGLLVAQVVHVKHGAAKSFLILDAAMNDLIRPALYDAWHDLLPVRRASPEAVLSRWDIVGPVCETGDTFARDRELPPLGEDDLVAFASAGAYGAVMSSTYNSRLLVPEVMVSGERFAVIRKRPDYDSLLSLDSVPEWIGAAGRAPGSERGAG